MITPTQFIEMTERTNNTNIPSNLCTLIKAGNDGKYNLGHVIHAAFGLGGEVGELQDALIKHFVYGRPLDTINIKEELGDILWFVGKMLRQFGWTFEEVMQVNHDKLMIRYPEKFTEELANNRNLEQERKVLSNI